MSDPLTLLLFYLCAVALIVGVLRYRDWRAMQAQDRAWRLYAAARQAQERRAHQAEVVRQWADGVERRKWVRALIGTYTSPVDEMRDWR